MSCWTGARSEAAQQSPRLEGRGLVCHRLSLPLRWELAESCRSPGQCPLSSLACGLQCRLSEGLTAPTAVVVGFSGEWDLATLTPPSKQVFPILCPCRLWTAGVAP